MFTQINNVNKVILANITKNLKSGKNLFGGNLIYRAIGNSCVSYVSRSLWLVGVPNIGIHPFINYLSLQIREVSLIANPLFSPLNNNSYEK